MNKNKKEKKLLPDEFINDYSLPEDENKKIEEEHRKEYKSILKELLEDVNE